MASAISADMINHHGLRHSLPIDFSLGFALTGLQADDSFARSATSAHYNDCSGTAKATLVRFSPGVVPDTSDLLKFQATSAYKECLGQQATFADIRLGHLARRVK
jgi:hypothetical protein